MTKVRQTDHDHNITKGVKTAAIFRGRTMACGKLSELLYPSEFTTAYSLHPHPQVSIIAHPPVAVSSIHGVVQWTHNSQPSITITRNFVRTLCVTSDSSGRLLITNDMMELSCLDEEVLMDPRSSVRLQRYSRKYNVDVDVTSVVAQLATGDRDFCEMLEDLRGVPLAVLEECATFCGGDALMGVSLGRLVSRRHLTPLEAVEAFKSIGGDPSRLSEILPTR
jgi:hypothetical protein